MPVGILPLSTLVAPSSLSARPDAPGHRVARPARSQRVAVPSRHPRTLRASTRQRLPGPTPGDVDPNSLTLTRQLLLLVALHAVEHLDLALARPPARFPGTPNDSVETALLRDRTLD
jgi:hypothetical protein